MAKLISLVVPFYNEEKSISYFSRVIIPILESIDLVEWEIICVDDGSSDNTLSELLTLSQVDPRFRVLELSRNFGKEAALTAGLDAAKGAAVVIIDADLQDPPDVIPKMVNEWNAGAEVVLGRRIDRSSDSFLKRQTSSLFYFFYNRLAHIRIPENVGDFRLIDRCVVDAIKQMPERQRFMKGIFTWVGFRTVTIDYVRAPRAAGLTKFSGFSLWYLAVEGFTSFSSIPIRAWTYLGALGAVFAIMYGLFIAMRTIIWGNPVPGYTSLFVAITFFSSIQIISIGMLGEYIGRIYMETKQRPIYLVRKFYN